MIRLHTLVPLSDVSGVGGARQTAQLLAQSAGLSEAKAGQVALIVTELGTNLIKHASEGSILLGSDDERPGSFVIVAIDCGEGIPSVPTAMRDGYSTAGSPGTGLGAIQRASASFDIYTLPTRGTAVLCRIDEHAAPPAGVTPQRLAVAGICVPLQGEDESGDAWAGSGARETLTLLVADGLGHGPVASVASVAAIRSFAEGTDRPLDAILQNAHGALRSGRGAAIGVTRIYATEGRVEFSGVGNIAAAIAGDEVTRRLVSLNGIVGHEMRKMQTFSYPWSSDSVLIVHSDGVSANWNLANYPGLLQRDPAMIAAVLFRDGRRVTDDATIVVAKAT